MKEPTATACPALLAHPELPAAKLSDNSLKSRAVELLQLAYGSLPVHGKPGEQEGTVVAAVVLSDEAEVLSLVSLATGTKCCLLYTSPSPRDRTRSRMPSSA